MTGETWIPACGGNPTMFDALALAIERGIKIWMDEKASLDWGLGGIPPSEGALLN
jgi:hypothetical protein